MNDKPVDPEGWAHTLDLGDGHWLDWIVKDEGGPNVGALIWHLLPPGKPDNYGFGRMCCGSVRWDAPGTSPYDQARWQLSGEPDEFLTVSPSVLCSCGDHGFIRGGCWVRA